jgi:uncharacterized Fe-S cluster protein YjdI
MKVTYDAQVCIHAGNCVKSLPAVFKVVDGKFVIDQQGQVKPRSAKRSLPARLAHCKSPTTKP